MYKKFLVVASKKDKAGINITTNLSQFRKNPVISSMQKESVGFDFYLVEDETIYTKNLDLDKINSYDFIIFASKHQSEKQEKTLSLHATGNWRRADYGGEPERVSKASAVFMKQTFEIMAKYKKEHNLDDFKLTMEVTHHGPLINKPSMFIEIGATESEWSNRKAGFIIAKTIVDIIEQYQENEYNEIAVGIGGPHYCPNFNKIQLNSNIAIAHVIPQYAVPITEHMILDAIEQTVEDVDFVLLDWKGIKSAEERKSIIQILDNNYIQWKNTSDIKK